MTLDVVLEWWAIGFSSGVALYLGAWAACLLARTVMEAFRAGSGINE